VGLGNNRDYITRNRRINSNLTRHKELMDALVAQGMSTAEASSKAFQTLKEQTPILRRLAQADCRKARKYGALLISETKKGLVELSYSDGTFTLTSQDGGTYRKSHGLMDIIDILMNEIYVVVNQ
jgi:hypothetical protein